MPEAQWYWGAVVRVDAAHDLLTELARQVDGDRVRSQDPTTGHITLFYAPLRGREAASQLADRVRASIATVSSFDLHCDGFDEFASETRPVAWLGITAGGAELTALRDALCGCDEDCHRHAFVPHLTLAYGEDPAAYAAVRDAIRATADRARITEHIDAIWIAGFPVDGHPARDLRYVERLPLSGG
ncbi:MAG: 2'-5' RNA ligase family protein [Gaiellales bacterium]